ncbi:MAG: SpaH/EbpB family LPXTG-anchored major pilin [Christensenella sp.]|nr:SpaH/EbpB family LPXTG-anchored major pilin [Christensenella sp.]
MKTLKTLLRTILLVALLVALGTTTALAADNNTITISSETSGHTYQAYQVFAGTFSSTTGKLTNITWGSGVNGANLLTAIKADATYGTSFASCTTAADVAQVISTSYPASTTFANALAKLVSANLTTTHTDSGAPSGSYTYTISNLSDGYYFVNEASLGTTADNAYTKFLLQVVDNVTVSAKTDKPAIALKVLENNDGTYKNTWNDAADYSIGTAVPYRIVSIVPDMTYYDTYYYQMTDTISSGSTFNAGSVKVYYVNSAGAMYDIETSTSTGAGGTELSSGYTISPTAGGFTLTFNDLSNVSGVPALGGGYLVVEYTATLNSNASVQVPATPGNATEVYLTYSNNPNNADGSGTGVTPKDEVVVYTFRLTINKVDSSTPAVPLTGATFALFTDLTNATTAAADPATVANFATALTFTGSAGSYTRSTSGDYMLSGTAGGVYTIDGLDQGTYYLVEISAPAGYNRLITPVSVVIDPTYHDGSQSSAYVDGHVPDATGDQLITVTANGGTALDVVNQAGATLPETGGMGTKLFTIGGLSLMLVALVIVLLRKKNAARKD